METERTQWHRTIERWLKELGVDHVSEHKEFAPYRLDIYLPELHVAVEADGPKHFQHKDEARDINLLWDYGVPTCRIRQGTPKEQAVKSIHHFLEMWGKNADTRKDLWRQKLAAH